MLNKTNNTAFIKAKAKELGFISCGIAKAQYLADIAPHLELWLAKNYHGKMNYMTNHFDKRLDPTLLVPNAKSIISLSYNYFPSKKINKNGYKIAKYAYGKDYHTVIKDKLAILFLLIEKKIGATINGRVFVDSAPIMERQWATKSGVGWIGKNGLLLTKKVGSFFFLAEIILDIELDYDTPTANHCGSCTKCIDSCPTEAITQAGVVDARACISYLTIELKGELSPPIKGTFDDWIFGCDICQDVCPWNRFSVAHKEPQFNPPPALEKMTKNDWQEVTQAIFKKLFEKSPLKRTGFKGLKRTINWVSQEKN